AKTQKLKYCLSEYLVEHWKMNDETSTNFQFLESLKVLVKIKSIEVTSLYDKGWIALYFLKCEDDSPQFFRELENEIESIIYDEEKFSELLLSLENTIGFFLGTYSLLSLKSSEFGKNSENKERIKKLISNIEKSKWLEYDGELLFSISLITEKLGLKLDVKNLFEKSFSQHTSVDKLRAKVYALLSFVQKTKDDRKFVNSLLRELASNNEIMNLIEKDLELSSIFALALSSLLELEKEKKEEIIDMMNKTFKIAYTEIKSMVENPYFLNEITNAAIYSKEVGTFMPYEKSNNMTRISNNKLEISLENFPPVVSLRLDLISKFLLSALECEFDKPYFLSKKEHDVYLQIKGETRNFKRVRKTELLLILSVLGLFLLYYSIQLAIPLNLGFKSLILIGSIPILFYFFVAKSIYERGYVSREDLVDFLKALRDFFLKKIVEKIFSWGG
ncbi:MAG: hypothetical protein ACP5F8_03275, partial [Candidatus Aenigmatarchaeota archaeon]